MGAVARQRIDAPAVLRIRTRQTAIRHADFIREAVRAVRYPGTSPDLVFAELFRTIEAPSLGVFVAPHYEPRALVVALLPTSALMMGPQVAVLYNVGPRSLLEDIGFRLREWLDENGFDHFYGINMWRDDAVFLRGLRYAGVGERVGGLMKFALT